MLLNLEKKGSAHVLHVSGDIDTKGTAILRAGITKLMKSGKDRIVLELSKVGAIDASFIVEAENLARLASELMGRIVVAGADAKASSQIRKAMPNRSSALPMLPTLAEAVEYLKQTNPPIEEISPEIEALLAEKDSKIKSLENQLALANPEEIRKVRSENESLRASGKELERQLKQMISERRIPPDAEAILDHVQTLERNLLKLTAQIEAASNAKK